MGLILSATLFLVGLGLVLFCAEQLVKGVVGTSFNFNLSAFLVSVIFIGFDPDNLSVGAVASYEQVTGIVWGSIIGAAMVAVALAFGITALLAPMKFEKVPLQTLGLSVGAVVLSGLLALDGKLTRVDGLLLLAGFIFCIYRLIIQGRRGMTIRASGEVAESLERSEQYGKWKSTLYLAGSLIGIILGSELLITASEEIMQWADLTETFFGMTILALLVSIEELARELPAALKGRPDITFGNIVGSIFAMLLFNGGIMALVHPIPLSNAILFFYFPYLLGTVLLVSLMMWQKQISRGSGLILVLLYLVFLGGSYFFS